MPAYTIAPSPELLKKIQSALDAVPGEKRGAARLTLLSDGSLMASIAVKGRKGRVDFTLGAFYDKSLLPGGGQSAGVGGSIVWEPEPQP